MPNVINFTGAQLLEFSRNPKGGVAKFSADYTASVVKAMGWSAELPESALSIKLDGDIAAIEITLTPKDKQVSKHEASIDVTNLSTFSVVRLETERSRGKGHRHELRFSASFVAPDSCAILEAYMQRLGDMKGTLKVSYVKQQELIEAPAESDAQTEFETAAAVQ